MNQSFLDTTMPDPPWACPAPGRTQPTDPVETTTTIFTIPEHDWIDPFIIQSWHDLHVALPEWQQRVGDRETNQSFLDTTMPDPMCMPSTEQDSISRSSWNNYHHIHHSLITRGSWHDLIDPFIIQSWRNLALQEWQQWVGDQETVEGWSVARSGPAKYWTNNSWKMCQMV